MEKFCQPDAVDQYKRLRAAARGLSSKIFDATRSLDFDTIKATTYLVCYDICDDKRLRRVFKTCCN